jgi:ferredoxin--NADP+ reductase
MKSINPQQQTIRVAIIGSGPAGFYTAEQLLDQEKFDIEVDMFDRLPTPYGLVRGGVAPDHQKIKSVTKLYERIAQEPGFRYYGYVEFGSDMSLDDLKKHYHQIVFATGTQSGKLLNIPGVELKGNHASSDFVAWYNGHPDYTNLDVDLSIENAVIIGMGNVAVDIARILCHTPSELQQTDIADYAMDALNQSKIKNISILGRRGPLQAAYTAPEIKELGSLSDADILVKPDEAELDSLSQADLANQSDRRDGKKVQIIQAYSENSPTGKSHLIKIRFLVSPIKILGNDFGKVTGVRVARNELYRTEAGTLRSRQTNLTEEIPAGLVIHSIGYKGVSLPGIPFNEKWGVIPNNHGRIIDVNGNSTLTGIYTVGWIKRGPSGVIGTNKLDAHETVECMIQDLEQGIHLNPPNPTADAAEMTIKLNQPKSIIFDDWEHLDEIEIKRGEQQHRPRVKFTKIKEMLKAVNSFKVPGD